MQKVREFIRRQQAKKQLRNAFYNAGLYIPYKSGDKEIKALPKIHSVQFNDEEHTVTFVFTLLNGMDPREVAKKEYVFKQYFGKHIEINGDVKKFELKVYQKVYDGTFSYDFTEFEPHMKKCRLPIIAGKDKLGKIHVFDMVKNPHLLIAGETGGGKSSILRGILTSLILFKNRIPNGLKLYLVDFKRSEFHLFRHIEDVVVINKKKDLVKCLEYLLKELEERGDLLDTYELTHIDDYNKRHDAVTKPYIILCIDEVHALEGEKSVFSHLHTISAMGRALGIYLIMATQRPDKDVIEGKTKGNLTVRYAFAHADKINSDITLGRGTKADASKITKPGQFIYRNKSALNNFEILQSPYLPPEDETDDKGNRIIGAKTILKPYKIPLEKRTQKDDSNVIDTEGYAMDPQQELTPESVLGVLKK
jgi:DNA segregation ATPase FtsK/SpoIIIE, S-DNA-T family